MGSTKGAAPPFPGKVPPPQLSADLTACTRIGQLSADLTACTHIRQLSADLTACTHIGQLSADLTACTHIGSSDLHNPLTQGRRGPSHHQTL